MPDLSFSQIASSIILGGVGFVAFVYGKKQGSLKPMVGGVVLMALPYILQETMQLVVASALILATMYVFRD